MCLFICRYEAFDASHRRRSSHRRRRRLRQFENDKLPHYRNILYEFYYFQPQRAATDRAAIKGEEKKRQRPAGENCFYAHCIFIRDNHALSGQCSEESDPSDRSIPRSRATHYAAYTSCELTEVHLTSRHPPLAHHHHHSRFLHLLPSCEKVTALG